MNESTIQNPRKANECIIEALSVPAPGLLFDEFWREGELALLFGASGVGKSVLAVQLGDALARGGGGIDGFEMPAGRRRVLYVDLDGSDAQFQARYTVTDDAGTPRKTYRFAENLYRDRPPAGEDLSEWISRTVIENKFHAVIVDSLSAVKRTHDGTRETLSLMRRLKRLTHELHVAILVLAESEAPAARFAAVSEADLGRSRVLCTVPDGVFAIGRDGRDREERHIIQLRSRLAPVVWTGDYAPAAHLARGETGMLRFKFDERFDPEIDEEKRRLICRVRSLHDSGQSYRAIAKILSISKSKAAVLDKKWTKELEEETVECGVRNAECGMEEAEVGSQKSEVGSKKAEVGSQKSESEIPNLKSEIWNVESEIPDRESEIPDRESEIPDRESGIWNLESGLRLSHDSHGREIYVEREDHAGRPMVWYKFDTKGTKLRCERKNTCIDIQRVGKITSDVNIMGISDSGIANQDQGVYIRMRAS
ncbi:MAG: AAA family ATPase [Acidobacteriota bacterium]